VVQVLDFGRAGDAYFLAMEYVDGLTLSSLGRRMRAAGKTPSPAVVGHVAREILAGLAFSHAGARDADGTLLRVVHRDLCPANVLVSRSGEVKIGDFGIARALRDADSSDTKTVAGHAAYMAPEQLRAGSIDPRWDVFAWGVMVFELMTGALLFQRATEAETLVAVMAAEIPDLTTLRPDVDRRWARLLARALAPFPIDRFADARAVLEALDEITDASSPRGLSELAALVAWALDQSVEQPSKSLPPPTDDSFRDAPTRKLPDA
jgi:serine/threonine-protein kinase